MNTKQKKKKIMEKSEKSESKNKEIVVNQQKKDTIDNRPIKTQLKKKSDMNMKKDENNPSSIESLLIQYIKKNQQVLDKLVELEKEREKKYDEREQEREKRHKDFLDKLENKFVGFLTTLEKEKKDDRKRKEELNNLIKYIKEKLETKILFKADLSIIPKKEKY